MIIWIKYFKVKRNRFVFYRWCLNLRENIEYPSKHGFCMDILSYTIIKTEFSVCYLCADIMLPELFNLRETGSVNNYWFKNSLSRINALKKVLKSKIK